MIKTDNNAIFGGFTNIPWKSNGGSVKGDGKSWLFKYNPMDLTAHRFGHVKGHTETVHDKNKLCCFDWAIELTDGCNQKVKGRKESYTEMGMSFYGP